MFAKYLHQKGAILILTALLLPMLICGTGLAVDLGNIYVQKTRLQNTADAAALAGAKAYAVN
ncbi:pilus assembly protein TadG-related protein, partial [Selenomonas sp.]